MDPLKAEGVDDGLLVIVVGGEDDKTKQVIQEPSEDDDQTLGHPDNHISKKIESLKEEIESDESEVSIPDLGDASSDEEVLDYSVLKPNPGRRSRALPDQHKSIVRDLCQQDPSLEDDIELLVDTLSQIMTNVKCPPPPPNFIVQDNSRFECGECGLKKDTKMAVARHWQDKHGPRCFICYACGFAFRSQTNLFKHEKRCPSDDAFIVLKARARINKYKGTCPGRPFHLPDAYHEKKPAFITCLRQTNPEIVEDREQLIQILYDKMVNEAPPPPPKGSVVYTKDNMSQCTVCGFQNISQNAVLRHWQNSHGPRYLVCYACGATYRDSRNLYKHEKRCTEPDACVALAARNKITRRRGRRRKITPPLHNDCTESLHRCSQCSAVFNKLTKLTEHMRCHPGLRPYQCEHCPAQFPSKSSLTRHKRLHKNETFICDHCARTFRSKDLLKSHLNSHLPQRKFPCPQCPKRYAQKWGLRVHIDRDHLNLPARCACQLCPKRYPRMSLLKGHMLKEHGMTIITRRMYNRNPISLTESQLKSATIVKKSDMNPSLQPQQNNNPNVQKNENMKTMDIDSDDNNATEEDSTEVTEYNEVEVHNFKTTDEKDITQGTENTEMILQKNCGGNIKVSECVKPNKSNKESEANVPDNNNVQSEISDELDNASEDLIEYAKHVQQGEASQSKPLIVIKDGQAIFMDKDNVDFYKRKLRNRKNKKVELSRQHLLTDVECIMRNEPIPTEPETPIITNTNNPMLQQEEVISQTKDVVTVRNSVSTGVTNESQTCQRPKIVIKPPQKRRKQQINLKRNAIL